MPRLLMTSDTGEFTDETRAVAKYILKPKSLLPLSSYLPYSRRAGGSRTWSSICAISRH